MIVANRLASWKEVTALVLGHLNPSQVGTSIASKSSFKRRFKRRQTWRNVRRWHFDQDGMCEDCGSRLELQADHLIPKEVVRGVGQSVANRCARTDKASVEKELRGEIDARLAKDKFSAHNAVKNGICADLAAIIASGHDHFVVAADRLDNMVLRCRRCNVIRRPSHAHGGKTFLTTEAALMWLLFVKQPSTYQEYESLCREYGLTMATIRFQEAWAMARWLEKDQSYSIRQDSTH